MSVEVQIQLANARQDWFCRVSVLARLLALEQPQTPTRASKIQQMDVTASRKVKGSCAAMRHHNHQPPHQPPHPATCASPRAGSEGCQAAQAVEGGQGLHSCPQAHVVSPEVGQEVLPGCVAGGLQCGG
jgi:hypothetical protein